MQYKKIRNKITFPVFSFFLLFFLTIGRKQIYATTTAPQADTTVGAEDIPSSMEEPETFKVEEQTISQFYFEWSVPIDYTAALDSDQNNLSKIKAFATEQAAVIELYGITRADINDFLDNGLLIFEINSVAPDRDTQFFQNAELKHLRYALLASTKSNTKLFLSIVPEDTWYFVETKECVQVYITNEEFSQLQTVLGEELSDLSPETEVADKTETDYPDTVFVLPVSDDVSISRLSIQDNYHEKEISISIPGNYLEYYMQHPVHNPYSYVKDIAVTYEAESNRTLISFSTDFICAYDYTAENGYLAMTIAKPDEIYDKIIILDAGHGGKDPGALQGKILEKDINYTIVCTYLKEIFENSDIKVYYTRDTDTYIDLSKRAEFASETGADLFISMHMNTFTSATVNGTQVYYSSANNAKDSSGFCSSVLAKKLVNKICPAIGTKNRGYSDSNYYVVKQNSVPAVLIELGFMTNKADFAKLTDTVYQKKTAQAIFEAITEIYEEYFTKQ